MTLVRTAAIVAIGLVMLLCAPPLNARDDVRPSCRRDDAQGSFWLHVRLESRWSDAAGAQHESADLIYIECRSVRSSARCHGLQVDLDKSTLGYGDAIPLSVGFEGHRGPLTLLRWGLHTMTVRWDRGVVETTFEGETTSETRFLPASCGAAHLIGQRTKETHGRVWVYGSVD